MPFAITGGTRVAWITPPQERGPGLASRQAHASCSGLGSQAWPASSVIPDLTMQARTGPSIAADGWPSEGGQRHPVSCLDVSPSSDRIARARSPGRGTGIAHRGHRVTLGLRHLESRRIGRPVGDRLQLRTAIACIQSLLHPEIALQLFRGHCTARKRQQHRQQTTEA